MKLLRLIVFSRALLVQVKGFQNIFQQFHRTIAYDVRKNMGALLCTDIPAEKEENSATNPVATASNVAVVENTKKVPQPKAEKIPYIVTFGKDPAIADDGIERGPNPMTTVRTKEDEYYWLRDDDRKNEKVLEHLNAENAYCESETQHLQELQTQLYNKMLSHLKETDQKVPYPHGPYHYYSRTEAKKPYEIHCRFSTGKSVEDEEVVLDENEVGKDSTYCVVAAHEPSPDHGFLAYTVDFTGNEKYTLRVKNLQSGELLVDVIEGICESVQWSGDGSCIFYKKMDDEQRPYQLWVHVLGTSQSEDIMLLEEKDRKFWMGLTKSMSGDYLIVDVASKETSECYVLALQGLNGGAAHIHAISNGALKLVTKRVEKVRYEGIQHHGDFLYMVTNNDGAKNQKLVKLPLSVLADNDAPRVFTEVRPYNADEQIDEFLPFTNFAAISGRKGGSQVIWTALASDGFSTWTEIPWEEEAYSVNFEQNHEFSEAKVRLQYSSMVTPKKVLDYNPETGERTILKQTEVPGGYDPRNYRTKRLYAPTKDGKFTIPISLVYHHKAACGEEVDQPKSISPLLLYGYGSYGACIDPYFDYKRIALLDRGVVYAIAHIRGGGEMGRHWYEDEGKYTTKMNTFVDFGTAAEFLIAKGVTTSERLGVVGRSAGGLLIGACVNMFPNLYKIAVADVPFVDVTTTMADATIPLTVGEWEEWGNPHEEQYFDYMQSYSPYDNVRAQDYPTILVTAGLHDSRVAFWEPAKWVARLRDLKTDNNLVLLKTDMAAGHFSASDRYKYLKEAAFELAVVLDQIKGNEKDF